MNLYRWNPHSGNGISKRDARVGISRRVENDYIEFPLCLLNPIHQFPFQVGLPEIHLNAQISGVFADFGLNISQRCVSVHVRFTLPQQVQIRSIQKQDFHDLKGRLNCAATSV